MKPDHDLRGCAYNQGCYEDLMEIREHVLEYLKTLKEVTYHTNADESDEIETAKLIETKPLPSGGNLKEFDYELDYKNIDFKDQRNRKLYRIGRGEQGVLLVRPYTNDICNHWRFKTPDEAVKSSNKIFAMYLDYRDEKDFIGMDMCRKFLEMGFTRARRYANHNSGRKYKKGTRDILPQEKDHATSKYAHSATIFKRVRDIVARNDIYVKMRKEWRASE